MAKKAAGKATKASQTSKPEKKSEKVEKTEKKEKVVAEKPPKAAKAEKPAKVKAPPKEKPPKVDKATKKAQREAEAAQKILSEEHKRWLDLQKQHGTEPVQNYTMSGTFEAERPLQHKILGWGFVLSNFNDRLEVIFETGIKQLISNYKPGK